MSILLTDAQFDFYEDSVNACVSIFNDYDKSEIAGHPPSVISAWEAGRVAQEFMDSVDKTGGKP